jgi:hypothetical protein
MRVPRGLWVCSAETRLWHVDKVVDGSHYLTMMIWTFGSGVVFATYTMGAYIE